MAKDEFKITNLAGRGLAGSGVSVTVDFKRGRPYRAIELPFCTVCERPFAAGEKFDRLEEHGGENRVWLYCEACSVEQIRSAQFHREH
jgi:hypothetical protein